MSLEQDVSLIIKNIRVTLTNLQLYPPSSSIVQESLKTIHNAISEKLKVQENFTVGETERHLLIDGQAVNFIGADKIAAEALVSSLILHGLKSITFNSGFTIEEITVLLEIISRKKKLEGKSLTDIFTEKNVGRITLNEKVFVAAGEQDKSEPSSTSEKQDESTAVKDEGLNADEIMKAAEILKAAEQAKTQTKPKSVSTLEEAKEILKKSNIDLLDEETRKKLPEMLKQLDSLDHVEMAGEMVDKLSTTLDNNDKTIRLKSAQSFKEITPTVASLSDKKIIGKLEDKFMDTEEKETDGTVYLELADLLEYGSNRLLSEGNYDKTIKIVGMFRRHSTSTGEGFLQRWQYAEKVLQKIANRHVVGILISDLRDSDSKVREQAYSVVMKMQKAAVPHLVDAIKATEDLHLRKIISIAIKNMGEGAIEELLQELNESSSPEVARRIIESLEGIGAEEVLMKYLKIVFRHYDPSIRKLILKLLYQIKTPEATALLADALSDADKGVRKEAVIFLGKLRHKGAVEQLISRISDDKKVQEDEEIQKEICVSLGNIADQRAIENLIEISKEPSFLSFKKPKSVNLRTAAIAALSNFKTQEVEQFLSELLKNKDKTISSTADNSLKRLKSMTDKKGEKLSQQIL